jgi:myo-inositol-1(or 4)-monophosphatase
LHAGVYHACSGGPVQFDEEPLTIHRNPAVRRHLAGEPEAAGSEGRSWDVRKTGSAAIECAFVAAGLLRAARFDNPNVWDVGAGMVLVRSAGLEARSLEEGVWRPFDRFEAGPAAAGEHADLRHWRRSLVIGEGETVDRLCALHNRATPP